MPGLMSNNAEAAADYLRRYQDVAAEGWDPWNHFQRHGQGEGRTWGSPPINANPLGPQSLPPHPGFSQSPPNMGINTGGLSPNPQNQPPYHGSAPSSAPPNMGINTGGQESPGWEMLLRRMVSQSGQGNEFFRQLMAYLQAQQLANGR